MSVGLIIEKVLSRVIEQFWVIIEKCLRPKPKAQFHDKLSDAYF
jgi:hypothetical protein